MIPTLTEGMGYASSYNFRILEESEIAFRRKLLLSMIEPGEGGTGRPVRRSYDIRCGYSGCPLSCEQPSVNERRSDAKKRQNMRGIGQINAVPMLIQF